MKRFLSWTYLRRYWCFRMGHPMADWSPIVMYEKAPSRMNGDGTITEGVEFTTRAWRCAIHGKRPVQRDAIQ